ncbi:MAG: hypothetical protein Pars2KO_20830 [Parasphingorhabdus sp.]
MPRTEKIFTDNPITSSVNISTGAAPTPYLVQDGEAILIFGSINSSLLRPELKNESVHPVHTVEGRAAAGFILADFRQASMGPHSELQFFVLASHQSGESIGAAPFALPIAMGTRPDWGTLCMRLWNDESSVLAYNNEYLGLNAEAAMFRHFDGDDPENIPFNVESADGKPIISGHVNRQQSTAPGVMWEMLKLVGFVRFLKLGMAPYASGHVINKVSSVMSTNRKAQIFTASDKNIVRQWAGATDSLKISDPMIKELDFDPVSVQHLWPFRFVYRHPDDKQERK